MSNVISISVEPRELMGTGNARRMRKAGVVPAIVYSCGSETIHLSVKEDNVRKLHSHVGMVELSCPNGDTKTVILKKIQIHPLSLKALHIDFIEVRADEIITVVVPIECVGEPAGLRQGGQLEAVMHEIEIQCLPVAVPQIIEIDVSGLELDQAFHIKDLVLAEGLTAVGDEDMIICHVRAPRTQEEETESDEEAEKVETAESAEAGKDKEKA